MRKQTDSAFRAHKNTGHPTRDHIGATLFGSSLGPGSDARLPTATATAPNDARPVAAVPARRVPGDGRPLEQGATSSAAARDDSSCSERLCLWCRSVLEVTQVRWCSKTCRQTAYRSRKLAIVEDLGDTPKRLGYADPPYPGMSRKYYGDEPSYAGEVDHEKLVSRMEAFDGWALSTSAKTLQLVLALCPPDVRIAAWGKPHGVSSKTRGAHNAWEPIIYKPARLRQPGFPDWLTALPARGGGTLPGRKPLAFCAFLFRLLGASPVDELDDLFPGTGIVGRSFGEFRRASLSTRGDAPSPEASSAGRRSAPATSPGDGGVAGAGPGDVAVCSSRRRRPVAQVLPCRPEQLVAVSIGADS